ncbi:MAG: 1-acyl-sn-glycerol-3-phosphate acyltransferase [Gammaproteobacteria bacterium]|nr:1-acyl-sn-glycerol-3-phosphate acyltransferase [Gammaproteobacteria bacterium]
MRQTITKALDRGWRLVGTGLSFAVMGVGGLILGVVAAGGVRLAVRDPQRRARLARRLVSRLFRAFVWFMNTVGVLRWSVEGLEHWPRERGVLVVANHPTLIDVVFLIALLDGADCVVKARVLSNPFWGLITRTADYVSNEDLGTLLAEVAVRLQAGRTVIVFPEGTRTEPGAEPAFGPLASLIAVRTGCPLMPVLITCSPPTLHKHLPWYRIPERRVDLRLRLCLPWQVARSGGRAADQRRAARTLTHELEAFYRRELGSANLWDSRRHSVPPALPT